jgi:hypothetical protein
MGRWLPSPRLRLFLSDGPLVPIDEQAMAPASGLAAFTSFAQARYATRLARGR